MRRRSAPPGAADGSVWLDGRIVPASRAAVSVFDRGFLYGDAFFETIRVYGGTPLLWHAHWQRLAASLRRFAIATPRFDLHRAALDLLAACRLGDAALRVTVSRGASEGLLPPPDLPPTALITARPVPASLPDERARGIAAIRLPFGHGRGGVTSGHKSVSYLAAVAGRMRAARQGAQEALFVEADGTVSEGTTSNVFAVRRGRLLTPPVAAGCLAGITREAVVRLARRAGIEVREEALAAAILARADEIFLTGTVIEVLPVVRLDGRAVGAGAPGALTRRLQELYSDLVRAALRRTARRAGTA